MQSKESQRTIFVPPTSKEEARITRQKLIEEVAGINFQLSNKNKRHRCLTCQGTGHLVDNTSCQACKGQGGIRWSDHEYHAWRQRALTALRAREAVLRRVNSWIEETEKNGTEQIEPVTLIRKAYDLLLVLIGDGVELEGDEQKTLEELRIYLEPVVQEVETNVMPGGEESIWT
jgi:hypothetical protein